jgi:chromosome segregation ATPase
MTKPPFLVLALVMLTAACVTDDPSQGGLFGGIGGLQSGTYSQRITDRKTQLENEQDQRVANQRALDRAQQEQTAVGQQRQSAEGKLQAMRSQVAALQQRLAAAQTRESTSKAKIAGLQTELADLDRDIKLAQTDSFSPPADRAARLEQLRHAKDALEREVQLALGR